MSDEYRTRMAHAEDCEQLIARFRSGDDPDGEPVRLNFAGKALRDWQEVVGGRLFGGK